MLEYAMLASLIAVVAIASVKYTGEQMDKTMDVASNEMDKSIRAAIAHNPTNGGGPPTF